VRHKQSTILFDTGSEGNQLLSNMKKLGIAYNEIDTVVLSHFHDDHTGGLDSFLEQNNNVWVYVPQSFPETFKKSISDRGAKIVEISENTQLFDGVFTTGELGTDLIEQSLVLSTSKGGVVITGCAHPGIVRIIRKAQAIIHDDRTHLVIGGIHLFRSSSLEVESVVNDFIRFNVERVSPCHCSGDESRRYFNNLCKKSYIECGAGFKMLIP